VDQQTNPVRRETSPPHSDPHRSDHHREAVSFNRLSERNIRLSNIRSLNTQWQSIVLSSLENDDVASTLGDIRYGPDNKNQLREQFAIYYIANLLEDAYHVSRKDRAIRKYTDPLIMAQARILKRSGKDIMSIVTVERGYDPLFVAYLKKMLNGTESTGGSAATQGSTSSA
jgi:hypothetical protein